MAFKNDAPGKFEAQSKFKNPKTSIYLIVESIAVGVEINRIITKVRKCKNILLKMKIPLLEPPRFFQSISIGSLAKFMSSTYYSLI